MLYIYIYTYRCPENEVCLFNHRAMDVNYICYEHLSAENYYTVLI